MPPRFNMWLAWLEPTLEVFSVDGGGAGARPGEVFAAVSLLIGLVSLVAHEFSINTSMATSVWCLEPVCSDEASGPVVTLSPHGDPTSGIHGLRSAVVEPARAPRLDVVTKQRWRSVHALAVVLVCAVAVLVNGTVYFELYMFAVFVMPYGLVVELALLAYVFSMAAIKTTIVAGWQRRQWLQTLPWVRFTLPI